MSRRGTEVPLGFTEEAVLGFIGAELHPLLYQIEHRSLDHGTHWRWWRNQTLFTPLGVVRLVEHLREAGHCVAADRLDDQRRMHLEKPGTDWQREPLLQKGVA